MAGLDKIKSQILDEAKETANVKIEDAKAQAESPEKTRLLFLMAMMWQKVPKQKKFPQMKCTDTRKGKIYA